MGVLVLVRKKLNNMRGEASGHSKPALLQRDDV